MKKSKSEDNDYLDVLKKLEELRRICLYTKGGRVRKNPNLGEANRALAHAVSALNGMRKHRKEKIIPPGPFPYWDRQETNQMPIEELKKKIFKKLRQARKADGEEDGAG